MRSICVTFLIALLIGNPAIGREPHPLPRGLPPVMGVARIAPVGDTADNDDNLAIELTVPKPVWRVEGKVVPKRDWPHVVVDVERNSRTLQLGGPSALSPSRVVDMTGRELDRRDLEERLRQSTPVLVSVTGKPIETFYLQTVKPDTLIVLLGPRDDAPAIDLLPTGADQMPEPTGNSAP